MNSTITLTFAIGSGLAAVASLMYCVSYPQVSPMMGAMLGLKPSSRPCSAASAPSGRMVAVW